MLPRVILAVAAFVVLLVVAALCLFNVKPASRTVEAYQSACSTAEIRCDEDGSVEILPRGGEDLKAGVIFYTGALIEPPAYIPLLCRLAERGYSCFIPKFALDMANLGPDAAGRIIAAHPGIGSWYLAGHSMGGYTASGYVDDHRDEADGLILIAAYTSRDLSCNALPTLALLGDNDGVMNRERYAGSRAWYPAEFEEHTIEGANHAQFGDYGKQSGDHEAEITAEEQQARAAEIMLDRLGRHAGNR